jgi:hypothetical protein
MPDQIENTVETLPELAISAEKVCYIASKAREFDVKDVVTDPGDSSNATDDAMRTTRTTRWPRRFPPRSSA